MIFFQLPEASGPTTGTAKATATKRVHRGHCEVQTLNYGVSRITQQLSRFSVEPRNSRPETESNNATYPYKHPTLACLLGANIQPSLSLSFALSISLSLSLLLNLDFC